MVNSARLRRGQQSDSIVQTSQSVINGEPVGLGLLSGLVLVLFLVRFFDVAESAFQGETLWIVGSWLVALLLWGMMSWKSSIPVAPSGWFGLGVGLLAGGHVISALLVVATTGDKRAAINLAWEWIGVATGWFLLRQMCQSLSFRRELLAGIIATGTCVAGLGLYQHYVEFPAMASKFGPLFDRLKVADPVEAGLIRKELAKENIPTEGPSLTLFEKRLRDSRESIGFFALANNLGGFLSVCVILAASVVLSNWQSTDSTRWRRLALWGVILIVLSWSLLLTKSRTAWIGTVIGLGLSGMFSGNVRFIGMRWRLVLALMAIVALSGLGLSRLGGLDIQVLTEAPKSLQYRLQYWSATLPMIRDHFAFGVGPGQFRWNYLFYKLPEASEEISDPHNLFLDVASSAGLVSVLGLLLICFYLLKTVVKRQSDSVLSETSSPSVVLNVVVGITGLIWVIFLFSGADDRLLVVLPLVAALFWLLRRVLLPFVHDSYGMASCWFAASFSLLVHLCGAGGIGMPAISLLLMALIAAADGSRTDVAKFSGYLKSGNAIAVGTIAVGLLVGLFMTGVRPVAIVDEKLFAGDQHARNGNLVAADGEYLGAESADRWSAEATRRRAELAYQRAQVDQFHSNDLFQAAVELMGHARLRDPTSFRDDARLGAWWIARWNLTRQVSDAKEAVAAYESAVARYPTNALLMAELAFARDSAGFAESAKEIARQSLRQDDINHERGHIDRYLTDEVRIRLESLLDIPKKG